MIKITISLDEVKENTIDLNINVPKNISKASDIEKIACEDLVKRIKEIYNLNK